MLIPDYRVVILGAGKSLRGHLPSAIVPVGESGLLLDWLLDAFAALPSAEVSFVSGFMATEVMRHYRQITFHHNPDWERTGPARSLAVAALESSVATLICYSDVVFRRATIEQLERTPGDVVVAIDRQWRIRYDGRSDSELESAERVRVQGESLTQIGPGVTIADADGEFAGLLKVSSSMARRLSNVLSSSIFGDKDGLPTVLSFLLEHSVDVRFIDVDGAWAELNAPQDLARFVLGTKAESLERLRPLLKSARIGSLVRFTVAEWHRSREVVLARISEVFPATSVIVRSSSLAEDGWAHSSAGAFKSVLDLPTHDCLRVAEAIDEVVASYPNDDPDHQILVQKMLVDVRMSGVVMTRTHSHGAPYYVVNYDDTTARTDTVTSGEGRALKTMFLHRSWTGDAETSADLRAVIAAIREVEELVGHDSLDIEFAVGIDGVVNVLQVRPIAVTHENRSVQDDAVQEGIRDARRYFRELQAASPFVAGSTTSLSVMADWNPAEIVGTKPTRLALSLYRYIITDETWARQRAAYGYRDVRPANLIVEVLGHPYIDVRATFSSFIPSAFDNGTATKLVDHYLGRLRDFPELHDKVEFDIVMTCWTFDFDAHCARLGISEALDSRELHLLRRELFEITREGIRRCAADRSSLERTESRCTAIRRSTNSALDKVFLHLENAREHGALQFSHLARAGFVAMSLLRSLVRVEAISQTEFDSFLASLRTVSSAIQEDAIAVHQGRQGWDEFVSKYGHLRPGTYDINSPHYGSAPEEFLRPMIESGGRVRDSQPFAWDTAARTRIERLLTSTHIANDFDEFERFLRRAIEGRELGKFVFTRDLSAAIEQIAEFGSEHFVSRDRLAHVRVGDLLRLRSASLKNASIALSDLANAGSESFSIQQAMCLPDQIFAVDDLTCFEFRESAPNYVTRKKVRAPVVVLSQTSSPSEEIRDRIVLIPNADPGFDWIFSRSIAGLITMYGGVNSHMAIRMAEFQLPGVTGVGELVYGRINAASVLELDCAARQIWVVR